MSGDDSDDDESVWEDIGESTSAEPADDESTDGVGEPDVIDVEPVETGEQGDPDSHFEEPENEYASDTADGSETANSFDHADAGANANAGDTVDAESAVGTNAVDADARDDTTDAVHRPQTATDEFDPDQPAGSADSPDTDDDVFAELEADEPPETADTPDADEMFDQMDVSGVDGEALWDELAGFASEADDPIETPTEPSVDSDDHSGAVGGESVDTQQSAKASADSDEAVVDKRQYCQQCPYFSDPPAVACSHDGTEIVEVLTDGRFRLRGCPVVTDSGPDRTMLNDGD